MSIFMRKPSKHELGNSTNWISNGRKLCHINLLKDKFTQWQARGRGFESWAGPSFMSFFYVSISLYNTHNWLMLDIKLTSISFLSVPDDASLSFTLSTSAKNQFLTNSQKFACANSVLLVFILMYLF